MNQNNAKRIIVVLGMHRSGTSTVTRGLQALGVDLGSNLYAPLPGNNDKGFFEDIDVHSLDTELLNALNCNWHSLSLIPTTSFGQEILEPFKVRAIDLLRSKIGTKPFGLKDPKIARLLPFWHVVFNHLNLTVSYVVSLRHPKSVVQSLQTRDGFDCEKGYYLWLEHVLPAMLQTVGADKLVVDYDLLMADPHKQIKRMAQALDLPYNSASSDVTEFVNKFLDAELRHSQFELKDLLLDCAAPPDVNTTYEVMMRLACDGMSINGPEVMEIFGRVNSRLQSLDPALNYITRLERKTAESQVQATNLNMQITRLNGQVAQLNQAVVARDGQIFGLLNSRSWRLTKPLRSIWRAFV